MLIELASVFSRQLSMIHCYRIEATLINEHIRIFHKSKDFNYSIRNVRPNVYLFIQTKFSNWQSEMRRKQYRKSIDFLKLMVGLCSVHYLNSIQFCDLVSCMISWKMWKVATREKMRPGKYIDGFDGESQ